MSEDDKTSSLDTGLEAIRSATQTLSQSPGVYRMIASDGEVLYVGKAKSMKKRVSSYLNYMKLPVRLQRMIALTRRMEFITTHTEAEALLLESNLIKKLQPKYNILLRDDKSFPYILIREDHEYPQILKHRGAKKIKGEYFGPFASAGAVNRTISVLQRAFLLRNCTDHYFEQRSRPCLQYHIKRCTAPCVDYVSQAEYAEQVSGAYDFMTGKSREVQERLNRKMEQASADMDYEGAARYRDRIRALSSVQANQHINIDVGDTDVFGFYQQAGRSCVQVFFFRGGQNFGNRSYFPKHQAEDTPEDILSAFIAQFYHGKMVPPDVTVSHTPTDRTLLEEALSTLAERKVRIAKPSRGKKVKLIEFVVNNAKEALSRNIAINAGQQKLLEGVAELFELEDTPERIEVYDNSHISGTNMVGAMIVAGQDGFIKNAYRKFNIKTADAADDYGMMREVLSRRFKRALKELEEGNKQNWPDLLLIDGGLGQYNACKEVLQECGVFDDVRMVAIAKGPDRDAGREKFFMEGRGVFQLPINDPVLHFLQRLRDEAHRFAIGTHRAKRQKQMVTSPLDEIAGIGAKRKKALLAYFGSAKAVSVAGIEDLEKVEGISRSVAQKIYDHFQS